MSKQVINPIRQGADQDITLLVKDSTGAVYDMSSAAKLVVILYYLGGTILAQYSMNSDVDWKDLDVTDFDIGKLYLKLETSETEDANPGKIFAEIRMQTADVDYEDGYFDLIGNGIYVGEIVEAVSANIVMP